MHGRSPFIATRRLTALAMTALLLGGCSTWRMQGQAPATVVSSSKKPPDVRVTLQDGRKVEIYRAVVQGDSLVGVGPDSPSPRIAVALSDIHTLEVRTHEGGKTALLVTCITVGLLAGAALFLVALDSSGGLVGGEW
jgi:hypothetical protein